MDDCVIPYTGQGSNSKNCHRNRKTTTTTTTDFTNWKKKIYPFIFVITLFFCLTVIQARDACDWTGSGLDIPTDDPTSSSRVVRPLYLRCNQGRIKWNYPVGALRLLLKLNRGTTPGSTSSFSTSLPAEVITEINAFRERQKEQGSGQPSAKEFRGCIRVEPGFEGARIYLEGDRKLHLLHAGRADPRPLELVRCFVSIRGRAALYVEAEPDNRPFVEILKKEGKNSTTASSQWYRKRVAAFSYDLQVVGQEVYNDDFKECRPCSDEEMLQNFCTSDFVVKGTVTTLYHNVDFDRTELTIKASKVLRDHVINPVFIRSSKLTYKGGHPPQLSATPTSDFLTAAYAQFEAHFEDKNGSHTENTAHYGVLQRPLKCGTKVGHGEFLFMGRLTLGNPRITCAPRIGDWKKIRRKALIQGTNQCALE